MSKLIDFAKIEATGNDFVFIDTIKNDVREIAGEDIIKICDRHKGIGADAVSYTHLTLPTNREV